MIEGLKAYEKYHAAVAGLPPLPAHWALRRTKSLLREIDRRSKTGTQRLLSLRMNAGLVDHHAMGGKHIPSSSLVGYKHVLPGELVMNRMRAAIGLFGAASLEGLVSPDYAIFDVRPELKVDYAVSLFKTPMMASLFRLESRGLGTGESGFLRLYSDRFGIIRMPLPPLEEQEAIVRFLDHANRHIDQFVRAKKRLITLLNEQKQAIVHRAVTRGLDPNVKLKDSGVPWLGEIPSHWRQMALVRIAKSRCDGPFGSGLKSSHYRDSGVRVVRLQNIGHGEFKDAFAVFISTEHYATLGDHSVHSQDLVVAGLGDDRHPAGRACVAPDGLGPAMVKADCFRFRLDMQHVSPKFLALQLTATARGASAVLSRGATRERVNLQAMCSRTVALPPLSEQMAVVAEVTSQVGPLDRAIVFYERELALAREYRSRLIADVVTGQVDVRAATASLHDVEPKTIMEDRADVDNEADEADIDDNEAA